MRMLSFPLRQERGRAVRPGQPRGAPRSEGPLLGLMFCCHCLEILNSFWTGASHLPFAPGPENSAAGRAWEGRAVDK